MAVRCVDGVPPPAAVALMVVWGLVFVVGLVVSMPSPPDFAAFSDASAKKQAFFEYLEPRIVAANERILAERERVLALSESFEAAGELSFFERISLDELSSTYLDEDADQDLPQAERLQKLRRRVDAIPPALALAQAAKESGWGTSRFAREGYNYFGQHCFDAGCGFTPQRRAAGRRHEVARFRSPSIAVERYALNLNSHPRYQRFRELRADLRAGGQQPTGQRLADGLSGYSERGAEYVGEIKGLIRHNGLE